jgi:hypothetical protein
MKSLEENHEEWKEIRSRIDSIANVIFLIAGGALSLSISVIIEHKNAGFIDQATADIAAAAWRWLLAAIVIFLTLKITLVFQQFLLHEKTDFVNKWRPWLNGVQWIIGIVGFSVFVVGLYQMVDAATHAIQPIY